MQKTAKTIVVGIGLCISAVGILLIYGCFEVNYWIDVCDDTSSHRYIVDDAKRAEACKDWKGTP